MDRVGLQSRSGPVKVIVVLNQEEVSPECLEALQSMGLEIHRTIRNQVVGVIDFEKLDLLRSDHNVREVEVATVLRPHAPQESQ
jgi:hypothetical protein